MSAIHITGFSGMVPRSGRRNMQPNQAQIAYNCVLTSGEIRSLRAPLLQYAPGIGAIKTMHRLISNATGAEYWLAFNDDTDIHAGPIADSDDQRIYYTGENQEPRITNLALATAGAPYPKNWYVLGVYSPGTAPSVGVTGGTTGTVTRDYVYTFVTAWGEEGAPSPAGSVTGYADGTWTISNMETAPPNSGTISNAVKDTPSAGYVTVTLDTVRGLRAKEYLTFANVAGMTDLNGAFKLESVNSGANTVVVELTTTQTYSAAADTWTRNAPHNTTGMKKRIYRSVSGVYTFVKEIDAATTSTTDTGLGSSVLESLNWNMPPAGMRGITAMDNGIMAGFIGKEVYFCEPFRPHAYPSGYALTVDHEIVGLGSYGQTLVVTTKGKPVAMSGVHPDSISQETIHNAWPCLSKRGVVSSSVGVQYPCPEGVAMIGPAGANIVTRNLYTKREWDLLNAGSFISVIHDLRYVSAYELQDASSGFILFMDPIEYAALVVANTRVTAMLADSANGNLYVAIDGSIYRWDADDGIRTSFDWMSMEFRMPRPINLAACIVDAEFTSTPEEIAAAQAAYDAMVAYNAALMATGVGGEMGADDMGLLELGGSRMKELPVLAFDQLNFSLYADNEVVFSKAVTNNKAFRLKDGYKSNALTVRVSGNVNIYGIHAAESMEELQP